MQKRQRNNRSRTRMLAVGFVAVLAITLAACGGGSSTPSGDITIKNFTFTAKPVQAGATVTIANNDSQQHTVTSDDGKSFDETVDPGKTVTFTAPKAGTYKFHCNIHAQMHGTLTVQ